MGGKTWRIGKAKEEKGQAQLSPKQTREEVAVGALRMLRASPVNSMP